MVGFAMKTGSEGQPWIELERPKPAPINDDAYRYFGQIAPPELSERCKYWVRQIERGWLPNKHISRNGYSGATEWYGVYVWEYVNVLYPLIESKRRALAT